MKSWRALQAAVVGFLFFGCVLAPAMPARATGLQLLHEFAGAPDEGRNPYGSLTMGLGKMFGTTGSDGASDYGTVFSMNADGSGFTILHRFAGGTIGGKAPGGGLTLAGGKLYGMTRLGGDSNYGTIFSLNADGTDFTLLHSFADEPNDGGRPYRDFVLSGNTLFGMTAHGGDLGRGTIFSIDTDGSNYTLLRSFMGGSNDGARPYDSLTLDGGKLYGATCLGGDSDNGTIFSVNTDGTGLTLLHEFAGGMSDGKNPYDSLTLAGGKLYGMTRYGGDANDGVIFSIDTDGNTFALLHEFGEAVDDGRRPLGSLTLVEGKLYGMTRYGGSGLGTIFSIGPDGSNLTLLHSFVGGTDDGALPYRNLTFDAGKFYGMTIQGGEFNLGTIFVIPEPATVALMTLGFAGIIAARRKTGK